MSKSGTSKNWQRLGLLLVGLMLTGLLAACGDSTATTAPALTTAATTAAATTAAATTAAATTAVAATTAATTAAVATTAAAGATTAAAAVSGKSVVIGLSRIPASLDPVSGLSAGTPEAFAYLTYNDTVTSIENGKVVPSLAASWKQVDALNWEFKMRPNVTFSNGEPFDSATMVFSFDTLIKKQPRPPARLVTVDSWAAPDAATFTIKTKTPDPVLPGKLAQVFLMPPKYYTENTKDFATKPVGTGPYVVTSYDRDKQMTFKARADYWKGAPKNSEIVIKAVPNGSSRAAALQSGEVDLVQLETKDLYDGLVSKGFKGAATTIGTTTYVSLDTTKGGPLADKRVRQALNLAVDRKTIVDGLFGDVTKPATQLLGPSALGYDPNLTGTGYDVEKAKKLLAEAGVKDGDITLPITFSTSGAGRKETVEILQQYLGKIGVKVEAQPLDGATFFQKSSKGELGPASLTVIFYLPAPDGDLAMESLVSAGGPTVRFKNDDLEKLFASQRNETDPAKREKILQQMSKLLEDDPPGILMNYGFDLWAHSPKISGFKAQVSSLNFFNDIVKQ